MCGLFGIVDLEATGLVGQADRFISLGRLAQRRGSDASGVITVDAHSNLEVVKSDLDFNRLRRSSEAKHLLAPDSLNETVALFGHSRLETHGFSADVVNNQPVVVGRWAVLHNGIITNHLRIRERLGSLIPTEIESDSAAIAGLLEDWSANGRSSPVDDAFSGLEGEYSFVALSTEGDIMMRTNVGNLYTVSVGGVMLIASEQRQFVSPELVSQCRRVDLNSTVILRGRSEAAGVIRVVESGRSINRSFTGARGLHLKAAELTPEFVHVLHDIAERATERANGLRRCSICVLPNTFPGIEFDSKGRCSVCAAFTPPVYAGTDALVADLAAASPDGKSVLVCLSGGRDSCYILHLVAELGFAPVTYTYDWGMVTTAARENMARMCGALGVEHILVSPNIRNNRRRIRRALKAWLGNPRLSTLPILMAGDKPYFRFAKAVARERGGLPAVMADHPLETTGFKSMLAGARPTTGEEGGVSYRLDRMSLAKMMMAYGGHSIRSPGLLPSLIGEGAVGFVDYYVRHHEFIRPFSYIPWDEQKVETTLRQQYGWTSGADPSVPSWRMGDGTAPFYNLMYFMVLGMTEHDALRANQVRFGLLTRAEALARLSDDNRVSPLGVASYFGTVDLDIRWAMQRIAEFDRHGTDRADG